MRRAGVGLAGVVALSGCQAIFDLKSHVVVEEGGGGATTTTTLGGGGTGGNGGGPVICEAGAVVECTYGGPAETKDVGPCRAATQTCNEEGTAWSGCEGQVVPVEEDCSKPGDEDCNFGGVGCSEAVWSKVFAGYAIPVDVAADATGNVYIFGEFEGSLEFGNSKLIGLDEEQVFLAKLGPDGEPLWAKSLGDLQSQYARGLGLDPAGNPVIAGKFAGTIDFGNGPLTSQGGADIYVVKLNPEGSVLWAKQFGGAAVEQVIVDMAVDGAGDIVLIGEVQEGSVDFGGPVVASFSTEPFVAKLASADGEGVWARLLTDETGGFDLNGASVAGDGAGGVALLAMVSGPYTFGDKELSGYQELFLARFDAMGNPAWALNLDITGFNTWGQSVALDTAGNAYIAVSTAEPVKWVDGSPAFGGYDVVTAKIDPLGGQSWSARFAGSGDEKEPRVAMGKGGQMLVSFMSDGPVDVGDGTMPLAGTGDVVVVATDAHGPLRWARRFGNARGSQGFPVVALGPTGGAALACNVDGMVDFGNGPLSPAGGSLDLGVATFAP